MARLAQSIRDAHDALGAFLDDQTSLDRLEAVSCKMAEALRNGNKLLAVGNGGSCCDAMHFCEELTGRFRDERAPLAAIACTDPGHLTCVANDYGYDEVFSRWVRVLGRPGDVIVLLSTSGNSTNIIRASEAAVDVGITRVSLLGKSGGALAGTCEHEWIVPGETADRIQEIHMLILHTLIEGIERSLGV